MIKDGDRMDYTLLKALDEVVKEIRSMSDEELKNELSKSENTVFAKTVDYIMGVSLKDD